MVATSYALRFEELELRCWIMSMYSWSFVSSSLLLPAECTFARASSESMTRTRLDFTFTLFT